MGSADRFALNLPEEEKRFTTLSEEELLPYLGRKMSDVTHEVLVDFACHRDGYLFVEAITEASLNKGRVIQQIDTEKNVRRSSWYKVLEDRTDLGGLFGSLEGFHLAAPPTSIDYVDEEDMVCRFGWIHEDDARAWFNPDEHPKVRSFVGSQKT